MTGTATRRSAGHREAERPRYHQLADVLIGRIEGGDYPVGSLLPTESHLCAEFDVSRFTVREALRRLTELGLVQRRQGAGTQVVADRLQPSYTQSMRSISELFQYALDTRFEIGAVSLVTPDDETAHFLGRLPGRRWLRLDGLRRQPDGTPICTTRVFVHDDYADLADRLDALDGPLYRLIEARYGDLVVEVDQEITAEMVQPDTAEALGCQPGSTAVRVVRRYLGAGDKPMLVSINHHPADRFSYAVRLRRGEPVP